MMMHLTFSVSQREEDSLAGPSDDAPPAAQRGDGLQETSNVKGIGRRPAQLVGRLLMWAVLIFWGD
jgi:hypothetical protein